MTPSGPSAPRALAAALAAAAVAALAACGERPTPSPSFEPTAEAPRSEELAGAPPSAPLPPPPPVEAAPPPPPPPMEAPPAPRPGDRDVIYDLGPVVGSRPQVSPEDAYPPPPPRRREHRRYEMARAQEPRPVPEVRAAPPPRPAPATPHGRTAPSHAATTHKAPTHPAVAAAPAPRKPAVSHTPPQVTASKPAAAKAPAVAAKTTVAKSEAAKPAAAKTTATTTTKAGGHVAKTAHAKAKPPAPPAKPDAKAQGDRGERLQRLQAALKDAVAAKATLSTPDSRLAGQPADVTLALPADFAQTVRTEAEKAGLADAAASVNLTAQLAGDGYAITPGETQSQPLTVGQPTEFHWTATAQPNTKGPLRADVGADLLGSGSESLALGQVATSSGGGMRLSSRAVGLGLLVLIAVVVLAWLARGAGRTPAQRASARAAANRERNGLTARPLDMSGRPMGPPPVDRDPTIHPGPRDGPPPP